MISVPLWLLVTFAVMLLASLLFVYLRERNKAVTDKRANLQLQSLVRDLKEVTSSLDQSALVIKNSTSSTAKNGDNDDDPRYS